MGYVHDGYGGLYLIGGLTTSLRAAGVVGDVQILNLSDLSVVNHSQVMPAANVSAVLVGRGNGFFQRHEIIG